MNVQFRGLFYTQSRFWDERMGRGSKRGREGVCLLLWMGPRYRHGDGCDGVIVEVVVILMMGYRDIGVRG